MLLLFFWHFSYVFMRYKGFCVWEKLKRILKIELFINAMLYHLFFEDKSECNQIKISLNTNSILKCTQNCLKQGIVGQCKTTKWVKCNHLTDLNLDFNIYFQFLSKTSDFLQT